MHPFVSSHVSVSQACIYTYTTTCAVQSVFLCVRRVGKLHRVLSSSMQDRPSVASHQTTHFTQAVSPVRPAAAAFCSMSVQYIVHVQHLHMVHANESESGNNRKGGGGGKGVRETKRPFVLKLQKHHGNHRGPFTSPPYWTPLHPQL